jgi:transposase
VRVEREILRGFAERELHRDDRLAVEATTNTWPVIELLRPYVGEIVVSNPIKTKAIAEAKVKTDKVDAETLARLLRADFLPSVWQPDAATAHLRQLCTQRSSLVADRTAIKNRIHSLLHQRLITAPSEGLFRRRGREWLEQLEVDADDRAALKRDLHLLDELDLAIAELERRLLHAGASDPRLKLLITLPAVDVTCAQGLLAALGDIRRFRDGDHAASYLGLAPSTKQSAEHAYHGPITKAGNGHARWLLVQAAQHLDRDPGPLGAFFRRLARKKNRNVAVVACARKLVVIAYELLVHMQPYRYAQPLVTAEKLRRVRLRTGGARRTGGTPKDTRSVAKLPRGSRTIKALHTVYAEEELPDLRPAAPGERRVQRRPEVAGFIDSLNQPQVRPLHQPSSTSCGAETSRDTSAAAHEHLGLRPNAPVKSATRTASLRSAPAGDGRSPGKSRR